MRAFFLFDIKAVVPSVSHEFMWESLELYGVPADVIHSYLLSAIIATSRFVFVDI